MSEKKNYRWFVLGAGVLAQAVFAIGFAGVPVAGVLMRDIYGFSLFELGVVLGAMGLGVAISEIIWGILTDKLGDKTVLVIGLWLSAGTFAFISHFLTPESGAPINYLMLSCALMAAGTFGGSINSSSGRTVMSWFDDSERGFAMSIRQTAIPVGGAIGTALIPWLAYSYGFNIAFLFLAIIGFSVGIFILIFVESKHKEAKKVAEKKADVPSPLKNFEVWKIAIAAGFLTVPQMSVLTFGGVYLKDVLNVNLSLISLILISIQIGGGALRIWFGYYTDKNKNRITVLKQISVIGGISALALCFVFDSYIGGITLLITTGIIGHTWQGVAYTETAVKAGIERAGTALGMIGTTVFFSAFLSPIMVSQVVDLSGWIAVWAIVGVLTLATYVFLLSPQKKSSPSVTSVAN